MIVIYEDIWYYFGRVYLFYLVGIRVDRTFFFLKKKKRKKKENMKTLTFGVLNRFIVYYFHKKIAAECLYYVQFTGVGQFPWNIGKLHLLSEKQGKIRWLEDCTAPNIQNEKQVNYK